MNLGLVGFATLAACANVFCAPWLTDYNTALEKAKREEKLVLMDFTGSDWCGWCKKLKAEVFDQQEFAAFAEANLILLEVDFPQRKRLSPEQTRENKLLLEKHGVQGFPTIIIVNPSGRTLATMGYLPGGPVPFISAIKGIPGATWKSGNSADAAPPVAAEKPPEPLWGGAQIPPKRYSELKLTGLSGPAARRLAIINNQTFSAGETARVKLNDTQVRVVCQAIRTNSVVVQVEGTPEPRELFLDAAVMR